MEAASNAPLPRAIPKQLTEKQLILARKLIHCSLKELRRGFLASILLYRNRNLIGKLFALGSEVQVVSPFLPVSCPGGCD